MTEGKPPQIRMDHVGIVVNDLDSTTEFFTRLGLEKVGQATLEGQAVDNVIGLQGVRSEVVFLRTPDGQAQVELSKFYSPLDDRDSTPSLSNATGIRHLSFEVADLDALIANLRPHGVELVGKLEQVEDYRVCYVRGPEGIIVELAEKISS